MHENNQKQMHHSGASFSASHMQPNLQRTRSLICSAHAASFAVHTQPHLQCTRSLICSAHAACSHTQPALPVQKRPLQIGATFAGSKFAYRSPFSRKHTYAHIHTPGPTHKCLTHSLQRLGIPHACMTSPILLQSAPYLALINEDPAASNATSNTSSV